MHGPGMLEELVEPSYCMMLYAFLKNHFSIFTENLNVLDQLGGKSFLVSLFLQVIVLLLCLCYLSVCEWIDGVLFVLIGKHKVHGFLGVCHVYAMPLC